MRTRLVPLAAFWVCGLCVAARDSQKVSQQQVLGIPDLRPGRFVGQGSDPQSRSDLNSSWGGTPPLACLTSDPNKSVSWGSKASPKRCVPDVCGGAVLRDIRGLDGRTSVSNLCAGPLFDSSRTLHCLRGKSILFLGDSTLQVGLGHNSS